MENLVFSLNATMPIFLLMVLGFALRRIGWISDHAADAMNKLVFRLSLPVLLFSELADEDFVTTWDGEFVGFCFGATLISIILASLASLLIKRRSLRGEFIQASYRSSAALLGIAYIQNIYGTAGMSAQMILGAVPLYNICAVIILELTRPENGEKGISLSTIKKTVLGILKNPIIIGVLLGFFWSVLKIPQPYILERSLNLVGNTATPLGLMAMGAMLDPKKIRGEVLPMLGASFFKLIGLSLFCVSVAIALGFREEKLVAILVMSGSATTVSSFVMAKNMGHEGTLSAGVVALTTVLSSFTMTFWIYFTKTLGVI